ncbi:MAG: hypothetical protein ACRD3J_21100, partial [Thermoanaerobaculia bacterium]
LILLRPAERVAEPGITFTYTESAIKRPATRVRGQSSTDWRVAFGEAFYGMIFSQDANFEKVVVQTDGPALESR